MNFSKCIEVTSAYPISDLAVRKQELEAGGTNIFEFGIGDPQEPTPELIKNALISSVPDISQYPTTGGSEVYLENVKSYLKRRYSVKIESTQQILPTSGSKEAVFNLPFLFIDQNSKRKKVIVGAPGYLPYYNGTVMSGGEVYEVLLSESSSYLLDLSEVPRSCFKPDLYHLAKLSA